MGRMTLSASRILGIAATLAVVATMLLLAESEFGRRPSEGSDSNTLSPPWISLPLEPALLSDRQTRLAIVHLLETERELLQPSEVPSLGAFDSRLFDCGDALGEDSYRFWYLPPWSASWMVQLRVRGDAAWISRMQLPGSAQVPKPPGGEIHEEYLGEIPLTSLEAIRQQWASPSLWHQPNLESEMGCLDGSRVILDACVRGKFAVRYHHCNEASVRDAAELTDSMEQLVANLKSN
jgi:hypothetical protein